jgi:ATP-dependent protease ClpP protease subunit
VEKAGIKREDIDKIMRDETWYTSEEYKKMGFVDEIK